MDYFKPHIAAIFVCQMPCAKCSGAPQTSKSTESKKDCSQANPSFVDGSATLAAAQLGNIFLNLRDQRMLRVEFEHLQEILDRGAMVIFEHTYNTALNICVAVLRVERNDLVVVIEGTSVISHFCAGATTMIVAINVTRVELDGTLIIGECAGVVVLLMAGIASQHVDIGGFKSILDCHRR